jgi:hypothetical protein
MSLALERNLSLCGRGRTMTTEAGAPQLRDEDDTGFPKLSAPARRALSAAGYRSLDQLAQVSESELRKLHGMGPTAIAALREALHQRGRSFRE